MSKKEDLEKINKHFKSIESNLEIYAESCDKLMPLVADSLRFTKKLVKLYQEAFNKGLESE